MEKFNYLEIENYLNGKLAGSELDVFTERLNSDKEFASEVELYKEISNSLHSRAQSFKEENDLRNTLEDLGKMNLKKEVNGKAETEGEKSKTKIFTLKRVSRFLVAASLVMFTTLMLIQNGKPTYTDFVNHQKMDLIVRGDSISTFIKVQAAFNAKDYGLAENELKKLIKEEKTKVELQMYLGICLLEQDKFEMAENIFKKIAAGDSIYKNKANWYLALSKLKQEDYKNATNFANLLPKDAEDYDLAQKLLDKL